MFVRTSQDRTKGRTNSSDDRIRVIDFAEVSYVVLTGSRPMITQTPAKVIIGTLDEIAALTRRAADTQSEFFGRIVERGVLLNAGRPMKISSAINPDWRLIRREEEEYFRRNTIKTQDTKDKTRDESSVNTLQEHIPDIMKFWTRTNG